jgi:hypothetical protein
MTWNVFQVARLFRPFLLIVGNLLCLVLLCLISARRDKVCPQYRVRNWSCTNTFQTPQKLSGPLGNSCTTFPSFFWGEMMRFWPSYSGNIFLYTTKTALLHTFWIQRCLNPPVKPYGLVQMAVPHGTGQYCSGNTRLGGLSKNRWCHQNLLPLSIPLPPGHISARASMSLDEGVV